MGKQVHAPGALYPQVAADIAEAQDAEAVAQGLQGSAGLEIDTPQQGAHHVGGVEQQQAREHVVPVKIRQLAPQQQHGGQYQDVIQAAVARCAGQQEIPGDEYGVKVLHSPLQQEPLNCLDFHRFQILAKAGLLPLKIPHNLENGLIILYPSPLHPPRPGE